MMDSSHTYAPFYSQMMCCNNHSLDAVSLLDQMKSCECIICNLKISTLAEKLKAACCTKCFDAVVVCGDCCNGGMDTQTLLHSHLRKFHKLMCNTTEYQSGDKSQEK